MKRHWIFVFCLALSSQWLVACGPRAFTKGAYDDPNKVILLNDKFNENDMQLISKTLVKSLIDSNSVGMNTPPPVVMIGRVANRTSEHIDMKMLTDYIRTALINSHHFRFSDKASRAEVAEEYNYQSGKFVDQKTAQKIGKQLGVQYLIDGELASNIQEVGRDKVVYYVLTLNMVNIETNILVWSDHREVRKIYKKRTISN